MTVYYSPGSASASFVELIGNATVLSGTELTADLANIFVHPGTFPIECLPAALHESAHHYCFCMPVGNALSACFLEAVRTHLADKPGDDRDDHLAEAIIRYDVVSSMLRPLAEGIALYAEFDAFPGKSRASISPPLADAFSLFNASLPEEARAQHLTVADTLCRLLETERLNGATIKRRENVLSQALVDENDGYLTGYWLIKNLRLHLIARLQSDALYDTDFYFQFIAHYFYADLTLANLILDFEKYRIPDFAGLELGQEDFLNAFIRHFQRRIEYLVHDLQQVEIDRMESAFASARYYYSDVQLMAPSQAAALLAEYDELIQSLWYRLHDVKPPEMGEALVGILCDFSRLKRSDAILEWCRAFRRVIGDNVVICPFLLRSA